MGKLECESWNGEFRMGKLEFGRSLSDWPSAVEGALRFRL
jgi:hypothetical protein